MKLKSKSKVICTHVCALFPSIKIQAEPKVAYVVNVYVFPVHEARQAPAHNLKKITRNANTH